MVEIISGALLLLGPGVSANRLLVSRSVVRTLAKTVSMIRLTQKLGRVEHGGLFTLVTAEG
jgi:hypothetical protein